MPEQDLKSCEGFPREGSSPSPDTFLTRVLAECSHLFGLDQDGIRLGLGWSRLIEAFFGPDDCIELHAGDSSVIANKGRPPLIFSWRSAFDIARLEQAARQVRLGKSLKAAISGKKKGYMDIPDESPFIWNFHMASG